MPSAVPLPAHWPRFAPPSADPLWQFLGHAGRASIDEFHQNLSSLLQAAESWPLERRGPAGELPLLQVLAGWDGRLGMERPGIRSHVAQNAAWAKLPLPGDPPWDGQGWVEAWALPAAALIARGADPFEKGPDGTCAFARALQLGSAALVDQMLRLPHAPSVDRWPLIRTPGSPTEEERSRLPLHAAAYTGDAPLLRVLIAHGAPVDQRDEWGRTPLMASAHAETLPVLVSLGADPLAEDAGGMTALERWSLGGETAPRQRDEWVKAARRAHPERVGRIKRAALFAGASPVVRSLAKIPSESAGSLDPVSWAVLGALFRGDHEAYRPRSVSHATNEEVWTPLAKALASMVRSNSNPEQVSLLQAFFGEHAPQWRAKGWPLKDLLVRASPLLVDPEFAGLMLPLLADEVQEELLRVADRVAEAVNFGWGLVLPGVRDGVSAFANAIHAHPPVGPVAFRARVLACLWEGGSGGAADEPWPDAATLSPHERGQLHKLVPLLQATAESEKSPLKARWASGLLAWLAAHALDETLPASSDRPRSPRM